MGLHAGRPRKRSRPSEPSWANLPAEELLDVRFRDLGLQMAGTALEGRLEQLHSEFERAGLKFRPYAWFSTDWFTPDGITGFAVPFYLAHPRLARLERREMFEVEGGTHAWCMKILRHEAAHAIDNAYRLHRKKSWRETFGRFSEPYRSTYTPDPSSRHHVLNLSYWYSQSHPAEDYAETFAVWLAPGSRWRKRYADWPALKKLEYIDELMGSIAQEPPVVRSRAKPESLGSLSMTLREYYRRKKLVYGDEPGEGMDPYLGRLFTDDPAYSGQEGAARFLQRSKTFLVRHVSHLTGQNAYMVAHVLDEAILRCRSRGLRLPSSEKEARLGAGVMLTALTMNFAYGGHPEYRR